MDAPFEVLGVDPDADDAEIDQAYRRRIMETHPDQGGSARAFQRVKTAYERIVAMRNGEAAIDRDAADEADHHHDAGARVEYLNYEVIDDRGWSLDDDDLFATAADAGLDPQDYGEFLVEPGETLLEAAENRGFAWPYACRGGACANCAVAVVEGEMTMPIDHVLSTEMTERGIHLSCIGAPATAEMQVVYNVKHMPELDELRLPAYRFERTQSVD
ncbi:ferredoxin Fer [Haloplanus aerogenes]|uniref:Ferredoxin n=1 Tax=Haloplanus aerogenes TaxID=660522 RepID=A0A3M0DXB0_9EURY|nr:ferredoxin Fer [Haloplanus aerogenes]AZH24404.1 ferredoxin [Haloplanus aerogenes]RMB23956.1 ferredoxin [Haloplanus aerogenes]